MLKCGGEAQCQRIVRWENYPQLFEGRAISMRLAADLCRMSLSSRRKRALAPGQ